jgi:hypothetical protein
VSARTGAGLVVTGSYFLFGDTLEFQAQVIDGATGEQKDVVMPVSGPRDAIGAALDQLATRVAVHLFVEVNELPRTSFQWGYPKLEAIRLFLEGSALVGRRDSAALDLLLQAWELDTTWVVPRARAIVPQYRMRNHTAADSLTRIVYDKRDQLPESWRLSIQLGRAMYEGDWEAVAQYACQPFAADTGWTTGDAQNCSFYAVRANRPRQALEAWKESARRRGGQPLEPDCYHLLLAAHAYHMLEDFEEELMVARRCGERAAPNDIALAEYAVLRALVGLGHLQDVRGGVEALATMGVEDIDAVARMRGLGLELRYHGHPEDGTWALSRAAELFERGLVEDATGVDARFAHATILYHLEDWDAAWRELRALETLAGAEEIADTTEIEIAGYLGLTAARIGDAESVAHYEAWLRERDRTVKYLFGLAKGYLARIAAVQGRREQAVGTLRQAFKEGLEQWAEWPAKLHWRFDFEGIADYEPYQELIRPKG